MINKNFIINLFNLEVDSIDDFEVINENGNVFVRITLKALPSECPHCHNITTSINDYRQRIINHAILDGMHTELIYNMRRMWCPHCERAFSEKNPFVRTGSRVSNYTIMRIMKMLKDPHTTFSMAARATGLSVPTVQHIFDEHAGVLARSFPEILCIDEVYTVKYTQRVYSCVLVDFNTSQLYDLLPSRKKHDLYSYFCDIPKDIRDSVSYVAMDMWEPYRDACSVFFKNAKICVDSFHVVALVNRTFDSVRIRIMKEHPKDSDEYYLLKKYYWLLSKSIEKQDMNKDIKLTRNTSYRCRGYIKRRELLNIVLDIDPELETAYFIKEGYAILNSQSTIDDVSEKLDSWLNYVDRAGIKEFISVRKTIKKWYQEIINSFNTVNGRRISNGPAESVNSRINKLKSASNGYGVFERFRMRALYSINNDSVIK